MCSSDLIQIFKVLLESDAGEHGARMAAMDNATRNAGEMIDERTDCGICWNVRNIFVKNF